ncbi:hypothetical protein [Streptomyces cavernae]|uniref:hypothetical protein n=1 Tax=Streptomyces cavernae TaxID=2259034 RepID=UPI000FEBDBB8|nr:hypothetical protein [Streptomyces cavernae]
MASSHRTLVGAHRYEPPTGASPRWRNRGVQLPALVACAFTLAQLALVRPGMGLGWDESVYVSQVSSHAPAAFFSAPRARGVSLLVAPIASWSSSTELLRVYLAVLSGLGLYLALRAWRGLFSARVMALAGALFASLWVTLFYGPQAMPNYWVAIGALAGIGHFLRARADRFDRTAPWGVAASVALMAWMRPTDAVWVTLPLLVLLLAVRSFRSPRLLVAILAGLVAGAGEWVVEAYIGYGGLEQRLSDASAIQGGLGWNIAVLDQIRSLAGKSLCRPCTVPLPPLPVYAWFLALPLLAALGAVFALRARRPTTTLVPLTCAVTAGIPYLLMIGYAAPRFLLPCYALLSIPVADVFVRLVTVPNRTARRVAVALVATGLAGHLAVQYAVLHKTVTRTTASHQGWARTADDLHRLGVRPPCLLSGHLAIPIAFYAGCGSVQTKGHNTNITRPDLLRVAERTPLAVLTTAHGTPPAFARDWPSHPSGKLRIWVGPAARQDGTAGQ